MIRALLQLFGDYGTPINVGPFVDRKDENAATPGLELLRGKRLAVVQEAGGKILNSERLKLMSGGLDQDLSRGLYRGFSVLNTTSALAFVGNQAPRLDWGDSALVERLLIMETRGREETEVRRFVGDTFTGPVNVPVLQRLLTLILEWGRIDPGASTPRPDEMGQLIESEQVHYGTPLERWVERTFERDDKSWLTSDQAWAIWQDYVQSSGEERTTARVTRTTLGRALRARYDGSRPMARRRKVGGVQCHGFPLRIADDTWWVS